MSQVAPNGFEHIHGKFGPQLAAFLHCSIVAAELHILNVDIGIAFVAENLTPVPVVSALASKSCVRVLENLQSPLVTPHSASVSQGWHLSLLSHGDVQL